MGTVRALPLAALALAFTSCLSSLSGFVCANDGQCGRGQSCIDRACAAPDSGCSAGYRWDSTAGSRSGLCICSQAGSDGRRCSGGYCMGGSCVPGCSIAGTHYDVNATNPANPCQACLPDINAADWSPATATVCTAAGTSGRCALGACCTGCIRQDGSCAASVNATECGGGGGSCMNCDQGNACVTYSCSVAGVCTQMDKNDLTPCTACSGDRQDVRTGTCNGGVCMTTSTMPCPRGRCVPPQGGSPAMCRDGGGGG